MPALGVCVGAGVGARAGVLASAEDPVSRVRTELGGHADVVFDCVTTQASLASAVHLLRRAGTLLIVGVPPRTAPVELPLIQDWELRLQGCAAYTHEDIVRALEIASSGVLPVDELTSSDYPLEQVSEAFQAAAADTTGKVFIRLS